MASEYTLKANLVIPEVIADLVEGKLGDNITLLPLATEDNTLVGQPGDTLKFPAFKYIGKATVIAENGQIETGKLEAGTTQATVHKYAKGISITDEARLSGHGDPMGEAAKQLARAIDQGVDDELFSVLNGVGVSRKHINTTISADNIADALVLFGEDLTGDKVLLTDAAGFAALRKDNDYIRASDLGQRMITDEVVGEVWGCQIMISNKIKTDTTVKEKNHFIVKPGALRLINKRGTLVEVEREPEYMRDNIFASKHCVAYLYDASKVVALTQFTGLQALTSDSGIKTVAGASGKTKIVIPAVMAAPAGYKWVYKLDTSADNIGVWDTALTGTTDWTDSDTEITASTNTKAHVVLVNSTDSKPVKTITVDVNKGA
ncbi:MAG: N4-gp56 family major capsid protein [Clostridiales bacterium]|jgi:hypothetical protein|nr:N4-gp56 family major capsid protein [Clostridiales bacterium]